MPYFPYAFLAWVDLSISYNVHECGSFNIINCSLTPKLTPAASPAAPCVRWPSAGCVSAPGPSPGSPWPSDPTAWLPGYAAGSTPPACGVKTRSGPVYTGPQTIPLFDLPSLTVLLFQCLDVRADVMY